MYDNEIAADGSKKHMNVFMYPDGRIGISGITYWKSATDNNVRQFLFDQVKSTTAPGNARSSVEDVPEGSLREAFYAGIVEPVAKPDAQVQPSSQPQTVPPPPAFRPG
ncbi:MAG: hypothetical protein IT558_05795 [Alphaproteobacteria bacterium]|nr:hypothetical protein [Alphaproteobacteria bacterium]